MAKCPNDKVLGDRSFSDCWIVLSTGMNEYLQIKVISFG